MPGLGSLAIGDASNGLCGGMVYTVRDMFLTPDLPPVEATTPPAEGTPLFKYIVDRLLASFDLPISGSSSTTSGCRRPTATWGSLPS